MFLHVLWMLMVFKQWFAKCINMFLIIFVFIIYASTLYLEMWFFFLLKGFITIFKILLILKLISLVHWSDKKLSALIIRFNELIKLLVIFSRSILLRLLFFMVFFSSTIVIRIYVGNWWSVYNIYKLIKRYWKVFWLMLIFRLLPVYVLMEDHPPFLSVSFPWFFCVMCYEFISVIFV